MIKNVNTAGINHKSKRLNMIRTLWNVLLLFLPHFAISVKDLSFSSIPPVTQPQSQLITSPAAAASASHLLSARALISIRDLAWNHKYVSGLNRTLRTSMSVVLTVWSLYGQEHILSIINSYKDQCISYFCMNLGPSNWANAQILQSCKVKTQLTGKFIDHSSNSHQSGSHRKTAKSPEKSHSECTSTPFFHTGLTHRENKAEHVKASHRLSEFPPEISTAQRKL